MRRIEMMCRICSANVNPQFTLHDMPDGAQHFGRTDQSSSSHKTSMQLCQCLQCGTVQHLGPTVKNYKSVKRSTKFSPAMIEFRKSQFQELKNTNNDTLKSVFELGAGEGEYLDVFKSLGFETFGIEHSKKFCTTAIEKGHNVTEGFLGDKKFEKKFLTPKFDAVVSFNFIEHLPKPKETLSMLRKVLKPGGIGLFEVPNFEIIESLKLFNEFIPDHMIYYNKGSFQTLLSLSGFEVVQMSEIWERYILSATVRPRPETNWGGFQSRRVTLEKEIRNFFKGNCAAKNAVWSAGHQSLATISNLGLNKLIHCFIDSSTAKQGKFSPVNGLPILPPDILAEGIIECVLVAAGGFNKEIINFIRTNYSDDIKLATIEEGQVKYVKNP